MGGIQIEGSALNFCWGAERFLPNQPPALWDNRSWRSDMQMSAIMNWVFSPLVQTSPELIFDFFKGCITFKMIYIHSFEHLLFERLNLKTVFSLEMLKTSNLVLCRNPPFDMYFDASLDHKISWGAWILVESYIPNHSFVSGKAEVRSLCNNFVPHVSLKNTVLRTSGVARCCIKCSHRS